MSTNAIKITSGSKLNLRLQLTNGAVDKRVFVELRDQENSLIEPEFEINHAQFGMYREQLKTMPNKSQVVASFRVTEQDGLTDADYDRVYDVYSLSLVEDLIVNNSGSGSVSGDLEGEVFETILEGEIFSEVIEGETKE